MNPSRTLAGSYVAAISIDTLGALAPWSGGATLPKPSRLAGTWILWFLLGLVSSFGDRLARLAGAFSMLVLAAMLLIGPFGDKLTVGIGRLARLYQQPGAPAPAAAAAAGQPAAAGGTA